MRSRRSLKSTNTSYKNIYIDESGFKINKSQTIKVLISIIHNQKNKMIIINKNKLSILNVLIPLMEFF